MLKSKSSRWLAGPYLVWMAIFTVVPLFIVIWYAMTNADGQFTFDNLTQIGRYSSVFARSLILAAISTVICLVMAFPVGYFLSRLRANKQHILLMLIMLPMWMNFLLRTYAWMSILDNSGLLNQFFQAVGIIDLGNLFNGWLNDVCAAINTAVRPALKDLPGIGGLLPADFLLDAARPTDMKFFKLLNTQGAVVLGMVYNYLPFMILPIYSILIKIERNVVEAAEDLGANPFQVFRKVTLPLSMPGVMSGIIMVFVPAVSTFIISKMLGGGMFMLIGDYIEMQFLGNTYNPGVGSAISLILMVIILISLFFMRGLDEETKEGILG